MQFKKYLVTLLLLVLSLQGLKAQDIYKVKVLFFSFGNQEFPFVHSDSVIVNKTSNDTTWFNTTVSCPSGQGFYYRAGQKVYKKESATDILLYDYSLGKGDTFILHTNANLHDTFTVDSVYPKKMGQRTFKAWHLTVRNYFNGRVHMEWIEGIGELSLGWDTKHYTFTDGGWEIKGMCLDDSVIYWDSAYRYFKDREPAPTCMFDSVSLRLSVKNTVKEAFNLYPNPASDVLHISSESGGILCISDYTGKVIMEDIAIEVGAQTIGISTLKTGVYLLSLQSGRSFVYQKICIINL